ncbi:STAS domain-containing protein [Streptomyces ficellus]|uniref:STAS domain-containing protein n=1 Tax=Streptomyces ficellus TaxID=1977088 RepID=A0A6I6F7T5_9ACTN|nr:STAS domain-containing protein [Streptomyces ficellus]QGV78904.1 STAS domain-containing protein [Streptomyces ficellus]
MDTTDPEVFRVAGLIDPADVPRLCEELAALLGERDGPDVVCDVGAVTRPNLATVEALARLRLTAQRRGRRMTVRDAQPALRALLELVGLADLLLVTPPATPPAAPEGRTAGTSAARPGTT